MLVAFAAAASAQESKSEKTRWAGHTTNKFWDNWELSIAGGVNVAVRDVSGHFSEGPLQDRIGYMGAFAATKWFHPIVGARLELQGGQFNNYGHYDKKTREHMPYKGQELINWPYVYIHVDAMLNVSNWLGGYRDDRVYYAVLYGGFGYQANSFTENYAKHYYKSEPDLKADNGFAATFGLINKFRVSKQVDINLEFQYWIYREGDMPSTDYVKVGCDGPYANAFALNLGMSYRFKKRGWDKAYTQADFQKYIDEAAAMRDQVAAANAARAAAEEAAAKAKSDAEAAAARAAAAEAEAAAAAARAAAASKGIFTDGNAIFFNLGSSKLTATDKTRLTLIADKIKAGDNSTVYTISGYADKQTGSTSINKTLSENRAKNVYNYLVSCGVDKSQLKYDSFGDTVQPFSVNAANRAAVIEK